MTTSEMTEAIHWPTDIITIVLSYCRKNFLIYKAGLVNKQWNESMKHPSIWRDRTLTIEEKQDGALSVPFIKQCNITMFSVSSAAQAHVILNEFQSVIRRLEMNWSWSEEEVTKFDFQPTVLPELEQLVFSAYLCDIMKKWLPLMPKLQLLDASFELDDEFKDGILSCKQLKKIDTNGEFDEAFTIQMLNELVHLEDVAIRLNENVPSSMWDNVLQIPGLLDRLTTLELRVYGSGPKAFSRPKRIPHFKNLKRLTLDKHFNTHSVLLFAAQNSVESLVLDVSDIQVDFSGFSFPKLKDIVLYGVDAKAIAEILFAGNNTLEDVTIRNAKSSLSDVSTVYFDLPKLRELSMYGFPLSILSLILNNLKTSLKELGLHGADYEGADSSEVERVAKLLGKIHCLKEYTGPPDLFKFIPEETIVNTLELLEISETNIESSFTLDTELFERVLKCSELRRFVSLNINSITADNWIPRLFKQCPKLTYLDIPKGKLESEMDLSQVEANDNVTTFELHASNLKPENRLKLFETLKKISTIGVHYIPVLEFSNVISDLNKFDHFMTVHLHVDNTGTDKLEYCELLTKKAPNNLERVYIDGEGTNIKFEDFLLMTLCTNLEAVSASVYYTTDLNPVTFFPAPYNTKKRFSESEKHAMIVAKVLLPDVVQRITGISEEKRQTILSNLLSVDEHPVLKDLCGTLSFKLDTANEWNIENNFRNEKTELTSKVEQLEDRVRYLEALLSDNNVVFDPTDG
jgi:hypothetical protein